MGISAVGNSTSFAFKSLKAAEVSYSPHLKARRPRGSQKRPATTSAKAAPPAGDVASNVTKDVVDSPRNQPADPTDNISFPLYFRGNRRGSISIPADIKPDECTAISLALKSIEAYAMQTSGVTPAQESISPGKER